MSLLRYAAQEAANIKAAEKRSRQQTAVATARALRLTEQSISALTKSDVGLGNVDNTSDTGKPVSTAQAAAIAAKLNTWVSAPATAASTGTAGQVAYDATYIYVCVATDTWVRAALATW